MNDDQRNKQRIRAHFVGAPFFVPDLARGTHARFAATGYNTGNLLIGDAAARLLDVDIVSTGTVVDMKALKDEADLIVVPAANFLSPAMDLSWLLPIIERSVQPILMVGVGAQFPTTSINDAKLPEVTLRLMKMISERSHSIGARGPFTAEVLNKYGIKNVRVTGCPSLFRMGQEQLTIRKPASGRASSPVFNGSSNVLGHAYSSSSARSVELKLFELAMAAGAPYVLQNELPEMLVSAGEPKEAYWDGCNATISRLGARVKAAAYCDYLKEHAKTFYNVDEWARFVANHDLVVGTRFHGNMIAISQGIAALFIAHDSRTTELCEALQIPYLSLGAFLKADLDGIVNSLDFSAFEKNYPRARQNLCEFFTENNVPHRMNGDGASIAADFSPVYERFARQPQATKDSAAEQPSVRVYVDDLPTKTDMVNAMKSFLADRRFDDALLAYEQLDLLHPKFIGATLLLAQSLIAIKPTLAAKLASQAIELGAADPKSYWIYAKALQEDGLGEQAIKAAKAGIEIGGDIEWTVQLEKLVR